MSLEQTCLHCGITETAGAYCTKCTAPTQDSWIHETKLSAAQRDARSRSGRLRAPKVPIRSSERAA